MVIKTTIKRTIKGLKKIWGQARKGLLTGVLSASAFLVVDGILGFLPEGFSNATKILIGLGILITVSLMGLDQKVKRKR